MNDIAYRVDFVGEPPVGALAFRAAEAIRDKYLKSPGALLHT